MSQQQAHAVYEAVSDHLRRTAEPDARRLWFVALPERYRAKDHPVLGPVNVDEVIGLRAYYQRHAVDWAKHWLGLRGFDEVMGYHALTREQERGKFPGGCPSVTIVPAARFYAHPSGGEIIVWANGEMDAYTDNIHTKRKQVAARPTMLAEGYGAWVEVFYDHAGNQLTRGQVAEICREAGMS